MSRIVFCSLLISLVFVDIRIGLFVCPLVVGLYLEKTQDYIAKFLAILFLLLTPISIYLTKNNNAFLIIAPLLPIMYIWVLTLQTRGWIMSQQWKDVLFLHYQADPELLQKQVPFKLDLYENKAILSIVSFKMDKIRFPFLPSVPALSRLNELNLRTYVEVNGIKGVYFFTLDADLSIGIFIAKKFFSLPYQKAKIFLKKKNQQYSFSSYNSLTSLSFEAEVHNNRNSDKFDLWATERYGLFTKKENSTLHGIVQHAPWELKNISNLQIEDHFSTQLGINLKANQFINMSYSSELNVKFLPFIKIKD